MARKKPPNLKQFRHDMAILRSKGLIRSVDLRSQKPTKHYKSVIQNLVSIIKGEASVVSAKPAQRKAIAETYGKRIRIHNRKVIVEHTGGMRVKVSKTSKLSVYDKRLGYRHLPTSRADFAALEKEGFKFVIYFGTQGRRRTFYSASEMYKEMGLYNTFQDWEDYVVLESSTGDYYA